MLPPLPVLARVRVQLGSCYIFAPVQAARSASPTAFADLMKSVSAATAYTKTSAQPFVAYYLMCLIGSLPGFLGRAVWRATAFKVTAVAVPVRNAMRLRFHSAH